MKKIKKIFIAISPIIFYLIIGVTLNTNHTWILPIMSLLYFFIGIFSKNKNQILLLSLPFLFLIALTLFLKDALTSIILLYLILLPISLVLGYLYKNKSFFYGLIYIVLISFIFFYGFNNWNSYIRNYNASVNEKAPTIELLTKTDIIIKLDTVQNKIIVLDFWTTSCGICFKKFPDYEKVYLEYKNNPNIVFYSVNIPTKRDTLLKTKKLVKKLGYKFSTLYADSDEIPNSLGFNRYPHLTILKNGRIRYNGPLEVAENVKINNLRNEINRLLNE
ncbi:redoxin domain-containing protein [Lutibacter sp.]|uniref:TlpA family protein disulfide reductase n=1 Tax=Lutibacter sp. TaxID=1925666 RepID=UPI0025BF5017|nr:redoxin domain-containing protein [Lutibacter sp.]MCF6167347.1 redoxin domain-containing protein [Lutibacter sp.]